MGEDLREVKNLGFWRGGTYIYIEREKYIDKYMFKTNKI